jgi:ABC-type phosphate/phosphonate transport system substrate-binding protein
MAIVSLPWYDLPETREATDALWQAIAAELRHGGVNFVPDALERDLHHHDQWIHPSLMFTQACGYDVAVDHARFLRVVAAPCFELPGCDGHDYRSYIVVREGDKAGGVAELRGRTAVINNATSHSGTNAFRAMIAPMSRGGRFFGQVIHSGGHALSLAMLGSRMADVACIDCVTWGLLAMHRPEAIRGLRVLAETEPAPAPPYVTSVRYGRVFARKLQRALMRAINRPELGDVRKELGLQGVDIVDNAEYERVTRFEESAVAHGYLEMPAPEASALTRLRMRAST